MMNKNDVITVAITDQDDLGQGIGKADGFPLFIRHAVTGDVVKVCVTKVKKTYGYGRILEYVRKSPDRTEPPCPVYKRCGGCQLQNMTYEAQLAFKQKRVEECLKRIGGCETVPMEPIIGADPVFRYRNKAQIPVGTDQNGQPVCGFFAERTHEIIPSEDCLLSPPEFGRIARMILLWMRKCRIPAYDEKSGTGLLRHIFLRKGFQSGELALCLVANGPKVPHFAELREALLSEFPKICSISLSVNTRRDNVILGNRTQVLYGEPTITDTIGSIRYRISPQSFYQVNPAQTEKLYQKALEFAGLSGKETVLDLYCGIGTISLFLAKQAKKVIGIEIVPQAIEDAKQNAALNGIENAAFYAGAAEEVLPRLYQEGVRTTDVVVVDPPRKGCDAVTLQTIAEIAPDRLVYVSCNPATLARDVKILQGYGYELERVQPVDMFPMSVHVETVVLMSRVEGK